MKTAIKFAVKNAQYEVLQMGDVLSVYKLFHARGKLQRILVRDNYLLRVAKSVIQEHAKAA